MSGRRSWRFIDGVLLAGLIALGVAATRDVWLEIFQIASGSEEQSHIFLAPAIAAWLVWVRRERLRLCRPQWTLVGPVVILAGWALAAYGFANSVDLARHFGALMMVGGGVLTIVGIDTLRRLLPAAGALVFLLPIPGRIRHEIAVPLQEATAVATNWLLELCGFPISQMGNVLSLNGHEVAVAEACNGMRMVAALGLVSYAFVFSVPMRNGVRLGILAISPAVALLVNIIRLVPTVLLYGYADTSVANAFHDLSGWVMLFVALGILWSILALLRWVEVPIAPYSAAQD